MTNNTEPALKYLQLIQNVPDILNLQYPIYIPSKGRAEIATTPRLLDISNVAFMLIVEPQDADNYLKHFRREQVIVMKENNRGISYARNACMNHARENGHLYHWQVDDNIKSFGLRIRGKNEKRKPEDAFWIIEQTTNMYTNIGGAGMKHQAFAFAEKLPVSLNRQVYTSMLLRTDTGLMFRDKVIEDTDFNLQMLFNGWCTLLFNRVIMNKETTMKMKGGNTEIHHAGTGRLERAEGLMEQWAGIFKLKDSATGPRIAPTRIWSTFQQQAIVREVSPEGCAGPYGVSG